MVELLQDRLAEIVKDPHVGSKAELARIAKVSPSAVSQWLDGGITTLKAQTAINIQERTGYSAKWIISGRLPKKVLDKNGGDSAQTHIRRSDTQKILALLKAFLDSDEEGRDEILAAVISLAEDESKGGAKRTVRHKR